MIFFPLFCSLKTTTAAYLKQAQVMINRCNYKRLAHTQKEREDGAKKSRPIPQFKKKSVTLGSLQRHDKLLGQKPLICTPNQPVFPRERQKAHLVSPFRSLVYQSEECRRPFEGGHPLLRLLWHQSLFIQKNLLISLPTPTFSPFPTSLMYAR